MLLFHLLSFSVFSAAALEKKSPGNMGSSGVEVAPGLAAAAAASSRGLQSSRPPGGGHLSPPLTSSFASAAAHQGVKKEPMEHQGSRSGSSRGFSPDSHSSAVHQYHAAAAAAARATPPHLSHPSPYSAYPYPEAAKLPPSLSGLTSQTFTSHIIQVAIAGPHGGPSDLSQLHHQKFDFYRAQGSDTAPTYT